MKRILHNDENKPIKVLLFNFLYFFHFLISYFQKYSLSFPLNSQTKTLISYYYNSHLIPNYRVSNSIKKKLTICQMYAIYVHKMKRKKDVQILQNFNEL